MTFISATVPGDTVLFNTVYAALAAYKTSAGVACYRVGTWFLLRMPAGELPRIIWLDYHEQGDAKQARRDYTALAADSVPGLTVDEWEALHLTPCDTPAT